MYTHKTCDVLWDKDKTYKLIGLLESSPELWNCTLIEYRDRHRKGKRIEMIAESLKMSTAEINRKLHNLRCQMNSELRKIKKKKSGAGADDVVKSSWEFFDALKFMTGISECVKIIGTIPNQIGSNNEEVLVSQIEEESLHEKCTVPNLATSLLKNKKRKINKRNELQSSINNDDDELLKEAMSVLREPKDDCDIFGEFVAVELRQIKSEERKRKLKRIIQRAIMDIGEEEDSSYGSLSSIESVSSFESSSDTVSECSSFHGSSTHTTSQNHQYELTTLSMLPTTSPQQIVIPDSELTNFYENFDVANYLPSNNHVSVHQTMSNKPPKQFEKLL